MLSCHVCVGYSVSMSHCLVTSTKHQVPSTSISVTSSCQTSLFSHDETQKAFPNKVRTEQKCFWWTINQISLNDRSHTNFLTTEYLFKGCSSYHLCYYLCVLGYYVFCIDIFHADTYQSLLMPPFSFLLLPSIRLPSLFLASTHLPSFHLPSSPVSSACPFSPTLSLLLQLIHPSLFYLLSSLLSPILLSLLMKFDLFRFPKVPQFISPTDPF